jgi:hypothetical protein
MFTGTIIEELIAVVERAEREARPQLLLPSQTVSEPGEMLCPVFLYVPGMQRLGMGVA